MATIVFGKGLRGLHLELPR